MTNGMPGNRKLKPDSRSDDNVEKLQQRFPQPCVGRSIRLEVATSSFSK